MDNSDNANKKWKIWSYILIFTGVVWFFQGINILPGSFMTGVIGWAIAGIFSAAAGLWLYQTKVK